MKYPYRVIKSGVLYPANTEVPDDEVSNAPEAEDVAKPEDDSTNADGETQTPAPDADSSDDEESEDDEQKQEYNYTKTEVNRMLTTDLHKLAKELGIEGEADKSGAQLKVEIINKLGL